MKKQNAWIWIKEKLQLKRLQEVVKRAYNSVPHYKNRLDQAGVKPEDIKTMKDIEKLPFTTKEDLRESYPFGMFAVPPREIVEIHTSSGTTGKPVVSGYTRKDLDTWYEVMARGLTMFGADPDDIIQNTHGIFRLYMKQTVLVTSKRILRVSFRSVSSLGKKVSIGFSKKADYRASYVSS